MSRIKDFAWRWLNPWNVFQLLVIVCVGAYLYSTYIPNPAKMSETKMYQVGTASKFKAVSTVRPIDFRAGLNHINFPSIETSGFYNPETGSIILDKDFSHTTLYLNETLRHEYGHALMDDFLTRRFGVNTVERANMWEMFSGISPNNVDGVLQQPPYPIPEELLPVIADYAKYPDTVGKYGSQNFNEYFAESFKAYVKGDGSSLPVHVRMFFDNASKMETGKKCNSCHKGWKK